MSMQIMYNGILMPVEKVVELKNKGNVVLGTMNVETIKKEEVVVEETVETPVLTIDEMKAKLTEASVAFHHAAGIPKLTELMKEHNIS